MGSSHGGHLPYLCHFQSKALQLLNSAAALGVQQDAEMWNASWLEGQDSSSFIILLVFCLRAKRLAVLYLVLFGNFSEVAICACRLAAEGRTGGRVGCLQRQACDLRYLC